MEKTPDFQFYLSDVQHPVAADGALWSQPLPMSRKHRDAAAGSTITTGEYFSAARAFLSGNNFSVLHNALARQSAKTLTLERAQHRNIFLEKHGEFYHPARVELIFPETKISFVLNVAVSDAGRNLIEKEYSILKRLGREFTPPHTPAVYGRGCGKTLPMFLGEWFENFHEFHLTQTPEREQQITVWDPTGANRYLSGAQKKSLYRKASRILTEYYHPRSFEHVFPWHHAAGDFVVCLKNDALDLRLITVRGYESLNPGHADPDLQSTLEALLVFFLTLSIRMRIDRRDGVQEMMWAEDAAVPEILNGFFDGLENMPDEKTQGIPLAECFEYYLFSQDEHELLVVAESIVDKYHTRAPERDIILAHLDAHVGSIKQGLIKRHL